jgi:hypothetical protein
MNDDTNQTKVIDNGNKSFFAENENSRMKKFYALALGSGIMSIIIIGYISRQIIQQGVAFNSSSFWIFLGIIVILIAIPTYFGTMGYKEWYNKWKQGR